MAAGFNHITDLYELFNVTQNTMLRYSKDMVIFTLKEFFKNDSYYHWASDPWGFTQVPDHTDLDPKAGLADDATTRVYIGEGGRFDAIYYPAILVKGGSFRYVPISMNRDTTRVVYTARQYVDGYGNTLVFSTPSQFVSSGAWEGNLTIDVLTRGLRARDDLVELIQLLFVDLKWAEMYKAGVSVKPNVSVGSPSESEDRNDRLFRQSVNLDIRTEWRREVPVDNILDMINICVEMGNLEADPPAIVPNITVSTNIEFIDAIAELT